EGWREAETDAELLNTAPYVVGSGLDGDAQRLQHVGGPGLGGSGPTAVLDDGGTAGGHHQRRHGGDVDRALAVTTRAHDVDGTYIEVDAIGVVQHGTRHTGDLSGRLALRAQRHREPRDLSGSGLAGHHLVHGPLRGVL